MYQRIIERSRQKNQDVVYEFDDDFLREELEKENKAKEENASYKPTIGKINREIFKPR